MRDHWRRRTMVEVELNHSCGGHADQRQGCSQFRTPRHKMKVDKYNRTMCLRCRNIRTGHVSEPIARRKRCTKKVSEAIPGRGAPTARDWDFKALGGTSEAVACTPGLHATVGADGSSIWTATHERCVNVQDLKSLTRTKRPLWQNYWQQQCCLVLRTDSYCRPLKANICDRD